MRASKLRNTIVFGSALCLIISCAIFLLYYPNVVIQLSLYEFVLLLLVLLLVVLPIGKRKLGGQTIPDANFLPWFMHIIWLQLIAYFYWLAVSQPLLQFSFAVPHTSSDVFLLSNFGALLFQGLHPWPLVLLFVASLGLIGNNLGQEQIGRAHV